MTGFAMPGDSSTDSSDSSNSSVESSVSKHKKKSKSKRRKKLLRLDNYTLALIANLKRLRNVLQRVWGSHANYSNLVMRSRVTYSIYGSLLNKPH